MLNSLIHCAYYILSVDIHTHALCWALVHSVWFGWWAHHTFYCIIGGWRIKYSAVRISEDLSSHSFATAIRVPCRNQWLQSHTNRRTHAIWTWNRTTVLSDDDAQVLPYICMRLSLAHFNHDNVACVVQMCTLYFNYNRKSNATFHIGAAVAQPISTICMIVWQWTGRKTKYSPHKPNMHTEYSDIL